VLECLVRRIGEDRSDRVPEVVQRAGTKTPDRPAVDRIERLDREQPRRNDAVGGDAGEYEGSGQQGPGECGPEGAADARAPDPECKGDRCGAGEEGPATGMPTTASSAARIPVAASPTPYASGSRSSSSRRVRTRWSNGSRPAPTKSMSTFAPTSARMCPVTAPALGFGTRRSAAHPHATASRSAGAKTTDRQSTRRRPSPCAGR
jgi:hypothetical protein